MSLLTSYLSSKQTSIQATSNKTMSPTPTRNLLPIAASAGAAILATAWLYHHLNDKSRTSTSSPDDHEASDNDAGEGTVLSKRTKSDDIIHREIDIITPNTNDTTTAATNKNTGQPVAVVVKEEEEVVIERILSRGTVTIAYCSTTGTCGGFAKKLHRELLDRIAGDPLPSSSKRRVQLIRVNEVDWWDELVNNEDESNGTDNKNKNGSDAASSSPVLLFVLPTWTDGTLPPDSQILLESLNEISTDWRVASEPLRSSDPSTQLKVGAFGMGSSAYDKVTVGKPAKDAFSTLVGKLGARPLVSKTAAKNGGGRGDGKKSKSLMVGDDEVGDAAVVFDKWMNGVVFSIFTTEGVGVGGNKVITGKGKGGKVNNAKKQPKPKKEEEEKKCGDGEEETNCACKSSDNQKGASDNTGCCSNNEEAASDNAGCCSNNSQKSADEENSMTDSLSEEEEDDDYDSEGEGIIDVEDMGNVISKQSSSKKSKEPQEMVTPKQAKALKKEGYKLIGTHSAVKLCRWTKHQLRGRGGCYKHTHYGITSYQCMEATPSLACANKCVFCWRHHKNPVGREWRWKTDDPKMIVEAAVNTHVDMIKETRGIPGIQMDRWQEAHTVRHCALSLVGEPIMYPQINELLGELHERKISTFLVTNGQHPKAIEDLVPITQLYVSVDASTPESLEAVDRPLFRDAWDRLKSSLSCLKRKGQRTVARLTVVKGWNSDEIGGYARLIALGHCSLVEVKGVTFCGKSDASNLNMSNTPWHHEVVNFTKILLEELNAIREEGGDDPLPEYDLACEHKHSCSVLLARVDQFAVPDPENPSKRKWKTWIDYDRFQELAARHAADPTFKFGVEDYIADTPDWAVFGADEEGFDPTDNRHRKKKKHPKYAKFDEEGVPTHDTFNEPLPEEDISKLRIQLEEKKRQIGDDVTVTALRGGEKIIDDASLMFRGLVVIR